MNTWHRDSITLGELDALRKAAERSWGDDTRHPLKRGDRRAAVGQSYVTARWLTERLGGYVGVKNGRYAWVSQDGGYVIDLAQDPYLYEKNSGYDPYPTVDNDRTERFTKRANLVFNSLDSLLKLSLDYMGDAYPAQEPQRVEDIDNQYWDDEPDVDPASGEYKFVYAGGTLEVSSAHDHKQLADHSGINDGHQGPMAVGWAIVNNGKVTWETQSNINLKALERVFKDYGKNVGWEWGGMTNVEGEPINDEFAPKTTKTLRYAFADGHLYLGRVSHSELSLQAEEDLQREGGKADRFGWITATDQRAYVWPVHIPAIASLCEWAEDQGLTLYAANNNVVKKIEDLELDNTGANSGDIQPREEEFNNDERGAAGLYKCPSCSQLFPRWQLYDKHRKGGCGDEPNQDGKFPEIGSDEPDPFKPHVTPLQPEVFPVASYKEASRVNGFLGGSEDDTYFVAYHYGCPIGYARLSNGRIQDMHCAKADVKNIILSKVVKYTDKQPKDLLSGPVPFIFDVDEDSITVGHQGQRTSDIPGRFTPGGIVEGIYEPGGKVMIKTLTNMPYTVRHMVELWYYEHPELTVTGVHLQDDDGGDTKLAATQQDVGGFIASLVASNHVIDSVSKLLFRNGGQVYAVGGAVRDAILGKEPKDIDLMVTGIPKNNVQALLEGLDGTVDYTGKDFGVFRYKEDGEEVEIALPRHERSTGDRHTDFDVEADHNMSPEEDLFRRDFTANAMAVNLNSGKLIDPYNGANDIESKTLRTLHGNSLNEDPLRVVRALVAKARHGLHPDEQTKTQMANAAASLEHLPVERVQAELDKLFAAEDPANAIRLAHESGVLKYILPEVDSAFGYDQNNPHHDLELGDHLTDVLERISTKSDDPDVRLAGLLHDIGKPESAWLNPERGTNHYYKKNFKDGTSIGEQHELVGARMARDAMNRLRYPKERIDRVSDIVKHHMFSPFENEKGARKFLNRVAPHGDDLLHLRWADQGGKGKGQDQRDNNEYQVQANLLEQVRKSQQPTSVSQLAINGKDLIDAGIPEGPEVGTTLQNLIKEVINDPSLNQRDKLLQLAQGNGILDQ